MLCILESYWLLRREVLGSSATGLNLPIYECSNPDVEGPRSEASFPAKVYTWPMAKLRHLAIERLEALYPFLAPENKTNKESVF